MAVQAWNPLQAEAGAWATRPHFKIKQTNQKKKTRKEGRRERKKENSAAYKQTKSSTS
jgi:hypothetical protein